MIKGNVTIIGNVKPRKEPIIMPTLEITKETVAEAVDNLRAAKKNPTVRAVRDELGGGSFTKIQPLLKVVLAENPEPQVVAPEHLKAFIKAAEEYTTPIDAETNAKIGERITRLQDDLDTSVRELKAAEARYVQIEREKNDLQEELNKSLATAEVLREQLKVSEKAKDEAKDEFLKVSFDKADYEALKERQKALEDQTLNFQKDVLAALADIKAKLEPAPKTAPPKKSTNKKSGNG